MQDHYQTLGVSATATQDEIKAAYRKLAMQHHPDRNAGSPESEKKFKELNEAHDTLKDPNKRSIYDSQRKWSTSGFSDEFKKARSDDWSRSRGRSFKEDDMEEAIRDLYDTLLKENLRRTQYSGWDAYGKKWSPNDSYPPKNPNVRVSLEVPLRSILSEQKRVININTHEAKFDVEVTIPKGVKTGTVITYKGKGASQVKGAPPGDLIVEVIVGLDPFFERIGDDLVSQLTVDSLLAVAGGDVEFNTIDNRKIKLSIPAGTQPGTTFRITGHGLPIANLDRNGHQFVKINLKTTTKLSDEHLNQIRDILKARV